MMRGARDGVVSGLRTTVVESCNVATALTFALQTAVEVVHGMTGADDFDVDDAAAAAARQVRRSKFAAQPTGLYDGLSKAYSALSHAVTEAYSDVFVSCSCARVYVCMCVCVCLRMVVTHDCIAFADGCRLWLLCVCAGAAKRTRSSSWHKCCSPRHW